MRSSIQKTVLNRWQLLLSAVLLTLLSFGLWVPLAEAKKKPKLEVVTKLDTPPGNIAVTADGRIILSQHQFFNPQFRVIEVLKDGSVQPFPDRDWSGAINAHGVGMDAVLGIKADGKNRVWMLDNGLNIDITPRLIAWNLETDTLDRIIYIPSPPGAFLNDLAIDLTHNTIFIADTGSAKSKPAIVAVNIETGESHRRLEGHLSVMPENLPLEIDDKPVQMLNKEGKPFEPKVGLNPITIDPENNWLYYGPMHSNALWRIKTADLLEDFVSEEERESKISYYGNRPVSDGISVDKQHNVYITDVANNAIGVVRLDGKYRLLMKSKKYLSWPDAMSYGSDGYFYVVSNQLHRSEMLNAGKNEAKAPYYVIRFKPLAESVVGR